MGRSSQEVPAQGSARCTRINAVTPALFSCREAPRRPLALFRCMATICKDRLANDPPALGHQESLKRHNVVGIG
jgi:hypothetical protein